MRSSRLWRVSSFHFLSLHCLGLNAQIPVFSRLSCTQPRGTGSRFRWSRWRMFYILRPPTLRTLEPRHLTFSRLLWPILNSWTFFSSLALVRARQWESCLFSLRFPGLGSSLSPPASLMQRPLTSPTSLVLWSRGYAAVPAIKSMLAVHLSPTSAPSWKSRPLLPSKPCRTTLLCSVSPTWQRDRQVRLSTLWPSFRSTKQRYWRRWMRGTAWAPKLLRSFADYPLGPSCY